MSFYGLLEDHLGRSINHNGRCDKQIVYYQLLLLTSHYLFMTDYETKGHTRVR